MLKKNYFFSILMMLMCLGGFHTAEAQTVTVSGLSGQMVSVTSSTTYNGTWQHNQAPLVLSTSNFPVASPFTVASNFAFSGEQTINGKKVNYLECYNGDTGGRRKVCFVKVTLPVGFRFTDYYISMQRGGKAGGTDRKYQKVQSDFYETDNTFCCSSNTQDATGYNSFNPATVGTVYKHVDLGDGTDNTKNDAIYTMARQSSGTTDMTNVLYFVYYVNRAKSSDGGQGLTFLDFHFSFAPNNNFTTTLAPKAIDQAKDSVWTGFLTNKFDRGQYSLPTSGNYGYNSGAVKEMHAFNTLYSADCYDNGSFAKGKKSIIPTLSDDGKYYYGLQNKTYYAECATFAKARGANSDGINIPVGYRITGAKINYHYGSCKVADDISTIFSKNYGDKWITIRQANPKNQNYFAAAASALTDGAYYNCITTTSPATDADKWCFVGDAKSFKIYNEAAGENYNLGTNSSSYGDKTDVNLYDNYYYADNVCSWQLVDKTDAPIPGYDITPYGNTQFAINMYGGVINGVGGDLALYTTANSDQGNQWLFNNYTTAPAGAYTLKVYPNDKSKSDLLGEPVSVTVDGTTPEKTSGSISLTNLNNDAVRFDIVDLSEGSEALVTVDLTLQPLDPYVKEMTVGFEPTDGHAAITKYVNSYDFNFGDDVQLLIPKSYADYYKAGYSYPITFNNLKSNYGDNTYYDNATSTEKSRYNFVKSEYYNDDYPIYTNAKAIANYDNYKTKVRTIVAGNTEFVFNNMAKLSPDRNATHEKYYTETLFTESEYANQKGKFENKSLTIGGSDTYYLFVNDEPLFNIAPAKTEHIAYAYYKVSVTAKQLNELPKLTWKKIYDKPFYNEQQDANYFSGVSVVAKHAESNTDGTLTITDVDGEGYLSADDIITQMTTDMTNKVTDAPADMAHVLYIDASKLISVITTKNADNVGSWSRLQPSLAKNALLFLPENTSTNFVNAVIKDGDTYKACANIVLTDKQPFYAPYDFYLGGDNYATYTRLFSGNNGQVKKATVMLPYALSLTDGTHTNKDGKCSFSVYSMKDGYAFTDISLATGGVEGKDYAANAQFVKLTDAQTTANKPYYVEVTNTNDNNSSFIATQYGASFTKTPDAALYNAGNGRISSGSTCTGTIEGTSYTFTNTATYAGETLAVATNYVFYFGTDKFYSLQNFKTGYGYVNPFRGYYRYAIIPGAKSINLSEFGVNTDGNTTDINSVTPKPSMMVSTGKGYIDIQTNDPTDISIYTLSGQCVRQDALAGSTNTRIALPKGFYIVNGAKVIVK